MAVFSSYNHSRIESMARGFLVTMRVGAALCLIAVVCTTAAAQTEPKLTTLNMPHYGGLARQARVQGIVKVAFTLTPNAAEPTNVELMSGASLSTGTANKLLNESAIENVKTWRFENHDSVEHRYETTFEFRLSTGKDVVSFQSFHSVTIVAGDEGTVIE
jgi:hypothetical protein